MPDDNWERIQDIFLAASELPEALRPDYLEHACAGDAALRQEVESLLSAGEIGETRVNAAVGSAATSMLEDETPMVGVRLGAYRIVREIGRGGMGAVYLAHRADDQFQKQVAIKVIKLGMDTADLLRRFRHERQILANLDHPHIARLLDGGSTPDGRPFFVMEYVEGRPIDLYCRERGLNLKSRLELFLRTCEAVSYAHRNRIVHRDLKPRNILVTADGTPKLLDFGVAKLLSAGEDASLTLTTVAVGPLTPEYASPEQARGLPVTETTDVYALGAVLFELLTETQAQRITTRSPGEIEKAICETPVERPSVAARDRDLARQLAGDIDNIVLMAVRKERERRYQSVDRLADDIRRYFDGRAVLARRDSPVYRVGKFLGRHRKVILTAAIAAITALGAGVALWHRHVASLAESASQSQVLKRLTSDPGLTMEPDISADGKMVTYVSDRGEGGFFRLWVQPVGGGEPRWLTQPVADARYPRFSPNGASIVYFTERGKAPGIYLVPTAGGEPKLLLARAAHPRFSPDGSKIACLLGTGTRSAFGRRLVLLALDGTTTEVKTGLAWLSSPLWSPDGSRLLFRGRKEKETAPYAWYTIPPSGGDAQVLDVEPALRRAGILLKEDGLPEPNIWHRRYVLFTAQIGDSQNLWEIAINSSTYQVEGGPRRLSFGTETMEKDVSAGANGLLAFTSYTYEPGVYILRTRSNGAPGEPARVARGGTQYGLSASADGGKLLYTDDSGSQPRLMLRDMVEGKSTELPFPAVSGVPSPPLLSPDGARIAYRRKVSDGQTGSTEIVVRAVAGGPETALCRDCGIPATWFPDGLRIATHSVTASSSGILDVAGRQLKTVAAPDGQSLAILSCSPDGRWASIRLAKISPPEPTPNQYFLAPLRQSELAPQTEWVPVKARAGFGLMRWSLAGDAVYFFQMSTAGYSVASFPFDRSTRQLEGPPQILYRFDKPSFGVIAGAGLAAIPGGVVFAGTESRGNIWLMQLPR